MNWPYAQSSELFQIQMQLFDMHLGDEDVVESKKYTCRDTWQAVRSRKSKVSLCNLVWHPLNISKPLICWLAIQNKLPTRDQMVAWGYQSDILARAETRDHICCECDYSRRI